MWVLGFVSMFMDISSEMIHGLLPVYLVTVMGASTLTVGIIEGVAEATAAITKVFSGALSDWLGKRKLLALVGYAMAAFTKPVFPLAASVDWLVAARFIDRIGKGVRGAPRDALVGDIAPPELRGACYGLRQSLDTIGAFIGPMAAIALMALTANSFTTVFWIAVVPAFIAVALLMIGVDEPVATHAPDPTNRLLSLGDSRRLGLDFWAVVVVGTLLALARFSEAFLVLRTQDVGLSIGFAPAILVVMNVVYALSAYPAGVLADRMSRRWLLAIGILLLMAADFCLAAATGLGLVALGALLWGLHMGLTQGILAAMVADTAPADLRATAFGVFNLAGGIATLAASVIAGALWDAFGAAGAFLSGAAFTALALLGLLMLDPSRRRP